MRLLCLVVALTVAAADRYHPKDFSFNTLRNNILRNRNEDATEFWYQEARLGIEQRLRQLQNTNKAKNLIMFLGDGLSVPTLAAARILKGQRDQKTGEETQMFYESFPTLGLSKTYCVDAQIADSACTATAYLSGVKNNYGVTGLNAAVQRGDCKASLDTANHVESIAAWALADGRDAGIVTTTRVTHASPSGAYANIADRVWEDDADVTSAGHDPTECRDIAYQLIHEAPGNQFKVILGGGRRSFRPFDVSDEENELGRRRDGRDLIEEWQQAKEASGSSYKYVWNRTELMAQNDSPPEYLLGLFDTGHLPYHLQADKEMKPTLAEMTEVAINSLKRNDKGFFLFVESGRIDHAHHDNFVELSLDETLEMDLAIEKAVELLGEEDTLIVMTADHSHVMAFNGYTARGSNILGQSMMYTADDGGNWMTLSYTNGPGARTPVNNTRVDVTKDEDFLQHLEWRTHADVPIYTETHGGDDVAVFATGPHHHIFTGIYEQSQIPFRMAYAACIGPGLHACNSAATHLALALPIYLLALLKFLQ